jgi:hypothetical protein
MNVIPLNQGQPGLLDEPVEISDDVMREKALTAFEEACTAGTSFHDALLAVYQAGIDSILGEKKRTRAKSAIPRCPFDKVVALYELHLPMLPGVSKMTEKRKKLCDELWRWIMTSEKRDKTRRAETTEQGLAWLAQYFKIATENDFLMGRTPRSKGHENWKPDFDFVMSEAGMRQILERTT